MSTATLPTYRYRGEATGPTWTPPHPDLIRPPVHPVKSLGGPVLTTDPASDDFGGELAGWAVVFGDGRSCATADAVKDVFSPSADLGLDDLKTVRVMWHHGIDSTRAERIGSAVLERRSEGVWAHVKLRPDLDPSERRRIASLARTGKLWFSSGSSSHLVRRQAGPGGSCKIITTWPISELSLTETPASRLATVDPRSVKVHPGAATTPDLGPLLARVRRLIESTAPEAEPEPARVMPDPAWAASLRRRVEHTSAFLARCEAEAERKAAEAEAWKAEQDELDRIAEAEAEAATKTLGVDMGALLDRVDRLLAAPMPGGECGCGCEGACDGTDPDATKALPDPLLVPEMVAVAGWALIFGGLDSYGHSFKADCDLGPDLADGGSVTVPLLVDHDTTKAVGVARLTHIPGDGVWAEALCIPWSDRIRSLLGSDSPFAEPVGFSTGAGARRFAPGSTKAIDRYHVREVSLTRRPAESALKCLVPLRDCRKARPLDRYSRVTGRTPADMQPLRPGMWGTADQRHRHQQLAAEALEFFGAHGLAGFGIST